MIVGGKEGRKLERGVAQSDLQVLGHSQALD